MDRVRWGILGTGRIATAFAEGLTSLPDAELAAVGSRSAGAAAGFAERFGAARHHGSYAALAADPDVDIIYVATPNALHHANSRLCLEAGKAVLCEKPFTLNAAEAHDLVQLARARHLFLMEAMWTRFLPALLEVRRLVSEEAIGELRLLSADFGFSKEYDPHHRLFNRSLGGGALLDVGIYLLSLAFFFFGAPAQIQSQAHLGPSGVDEITGLLLGYHNGGIAQLAAAITTTTPQEATLIGSAGSIRLHAEWWRATRYTITANGRPPETIDVPFQGNGYCHEAAEAMRCLRAGSLESTLMPLDETLAIIETMDRLRAGWGLRYPGE